MRLKKYFIINPLLVIFSLLFFWGISFGAGSLDCKQIEIDYQEADQAYEDCENEHYFTAATDCMEERDAAADLEALYYQCEQEVSYSKSQCPKISSYITFSNYLYVNILDEYCCFDDNEAPSNSYNGDYSCTLLGSVYEKKSECPDIADQINGDTLDHVQVNDGYCCFDGGIFDNDYDCTIYEKIQECPDIADQINRDTLDYVQVKNGYCCMEGGGPQYSNLGCTIQGMKYNCPNIASQISTTNYGFVDTNQCCLAIPEDEDIYDENGFLLDTISTDMDCSFFGSNYVLDGNCCIIGSGCTNSPHNGECESGYRLEDACCIEMSCEEINSGDKQKCDARIAKGEIVKWENCSCVCDPSKGCCGVQLNVPLPFIGDCIEMTTSNSTEGARDGSISINQLNAFPVLIKGISKIIVTLIMIFSVIVVIFAGVMMTTSVANESNYKTGLDMLKKVIIALILLGTSGLILKLINPSFFGG